MKIRVLIWQSLMDLKKNYYNSKLYINPPFSLMNEFTEFGLKQSKNNKVIFLIPARTDTRYFHNLLSVNPSIYFIKGRLKYNDTGTAPFPSILVILDGEGRIYSGDKEDLLKFIKECL